MVIVYTPLLSPMIKSLPLKSFYSPRLLTKRGYSAESLQSQLLQIPEFADGCKLETSGNFINAIPQFKRAHEVMVNSTGEGSDYAAVSALRLASAYRSIGDYASAEKSLTYEKYPSSYRIKSLQFISACRLLGGSAKLSLESAKLATDICEALEDPDYDLFTGSYGMQGLAYMMLGEFTSAEEQLQLAARWPQNSTAQLIGLVNLGYLHCIQNGYTVPITPIHYSSKDSLPNSREEQLKRGGVMEALDYWQEAIDDAVKGSTGDKQSTAAAMCGPFSGSSPLGPGQDAVTIPSGSNTSPSEEGESKGVGGLEEILAADIGFACAYSGVLCNIAEGRFAIAESDKASEALSAALSSLKPHQENPQSDLAVARCLFLVGCSHLHAAEGVTAEGLLRNALDKLTKSPFAAYDSRSQYERARVLNAYGKLLTKWDKREKSGEEMLAQSSQLLEKLPIYAEGQRISHAIQLPC